MPKVRYTYGVNGDTFSEEDVLPPAMDINLRAQQQIMLWNERAEELGEPERVLVKVEVIDAFIHEHVWGVRISRKTTGGKEYCYCTLCNVEGTRMNDGPVTREKKYESNYYEHCREKKPQIKPPRFKA